MPEINIMPTFVVGEFIPEYSDTDLEVGRCSCCGTRLEERKTAFTVYKKVYYTGGEITFEREDGGFCSLECLINAYDNVLSVLHEFHNLETGRTEYEK